MPQAQQFLEEEAPRCSRVRRLRSVKRRSVGERVRVEPRQQARRGRRDHVGLRIVNVRVDEARHDEFVAHVLHRTRRRALRRERGIRARCDDMAVFDDQQAVLAEDRRIGRARRIAVKGQQLRAKCRLRRSPVQK